MSALRRAGALLAALAVVALLAGCGEGDPAKTLTALAGSERRDVEPLLPSALSAEKALPRTDAERRPVAAGRTPHAVLLEQLDLMDSKMREAADAILAHDSEKLLANGRFLADRFGVSSLRLEGPVPEVAVPEVAVPETARQAEAPEEARETVAERERVR